MVFHRNIVYLIVIVLTINPAFVLSQTITPFKQTGKWGFKKGEAVIIEAQYDSIFGFDATQQIALVCNLNPKKNFINPLTKELKKIYDFYYITPTNTKVNLMLPDLKNPVNEFANQQKLQKEYLGTQAHFVIFYDGKNYLFNKNGKQITTTPYDNIYLTNHPDFFVIEIKEKSGQSLMGLINEYGKQIIENRYSKIQINTKDSLIICCTAGIRFNGTDDVFDYQGNKKHSSNKHIDYAGKDYIIYKLFEPVLSHVVLDNEDNKEKIIKCDKLSIIKKDEFLIHTDNNWYIYNLKTDKKIEADKKLYSQLISSNE